MIAKTRLAAALAAMLALTTVHAQTTPKPAAIPPAITTPDKVETRIGALEFKDGAPSAETVQTRCATAWTSRAASTRS